MGNPNEVERESDSDLTLTAPGTVYLAERGERSEQGTYPDSREMLDTVAVPRVELAVIHTGNAPDEVQINVRVYHVEDEQKARGFHIALTLDLARDQVARVRSFLDYLLAN